jgi:hypothetical protein
VWSSSGDDRAEARFGGSVASAGDVNGDGYGDILVGAARDSSVALDAGRAYLYLGGPAGPSLSPAWVSSGRDRAGALFGGSVASAGDVNGDAYGDIIVGATYRASMTPTPGRAHLYLGGPSGLPSTAAWCGVGEQADGRYGASVASAGDVDGDGHGDVIVGAPGFNTSNEGAGRAIVYLGGPSGLPRAPAWTSTGRDVRHDHFGISVASAGDLEGDGYGDVIVGAPQANTSCFEGRVYAFHGGPGGLRADWSWEGFDSCNYGAVVASAGDVDGDGDGDIAVGTPFSGQAFVHLQCP